MFIKLTISIGALQEVYTIKLNTTRLHDGLVQVQFQVSGTRLDPKESGYISDNDVTIDTIFHIGKTSMLPFHHVDIS